MEQAVCDACGTEVRDGSSFCFHCGRSVKEERPPPAILKPDKRLLNGSASLADSPTEFADPEPPPVSIPLGSPESGPPLPAAAKTTRFPAAAAAEPPARRQPRTRVKKAPEIEWEESSSSSYGFLIVAVVLAIIAGLMVMAALSMR